IVPVAAAWDVADAGEPPHPNVPWSWLHGSLDDHGAPRLDRMLVASSWHWAASRLNAQDSAPHGHLASIDDVEPLTDRPLRHTRQRELTFRGVPGPSVDVGQVLFG